jgi:drug/metabolite transporter (DMT)-like permease
MLLAILFWGGNFTASKLAFPTLPPLAFTAIRFVAGSFLLWLFVRRRSGSLALPREAVWPVIVLGVVGNTLYQLCFIIGLARTSAVNTSLILSAMPTVVTVSAGLLGHERVLPRQRWAVTLATIGVVIVVAAKGLAAAHGDWLGDVLILGAVACWTGYTLGLRRLRGMSALDVTLWTMLSGTPGLVVAGIPALLGVRWGEVTVVAWGGLLYSTLLSLVAAYVLWNRGVQQLGPSRAALYSCLTPLIATLIAMAILGERPTVAHLAGGALILGGVLLGQWPSQVRPAPEG